MHVLAEILVRHHEDLLAEWLAEQTTAGVRRDDLIREAELRRQCTEFLALLRDATQAGDVADITGSHFSGVREMLAALSRTRVQQGFTPTEVATFIFSFKRPLFSRIQRDLSKDGTDAVYREIWNATLLLDRLGLYTTEAFQKAREEVIARQQQEMLELSTPVVNLWDGILALPIIGTLDSSRTQVVMETLLEKVVETGAEIAIIDITGVPTVDTLTAQHLLKTVAAARLMGADCIISGIRPQIAQTIVHLAIDLTTVTTKASLADAFAVALARTGYRLEASDAGDAKGGPR